MNMNSLINIVYLVAAVLFILDLKMLAHPRTAVRGNQLGALGMLLAIVATLVSGRWDWTYIILGIAIGSVIGAVSALKVKMTSMPEMVGLFNGFGGGASVLVAGSALIATFSAVNSGTAADGDMQMKVATVLSGIIGSVTFFGSYVAFGKLAEFLCVKWKLHPWQKVVKYGFSLAVAVGGVLYGLSLGIGALSLAFVASALLIAGLLLIKKDRFPGMGLLKALTAVVSVVLGVLLVMHPSNAPLFWVLVGVAGVLGVVLTLSIGGADMPVVIALLNSYSGLAAAATGFVINNTVLIIAGSLVGASGLILTKIMCKAMNRSLANVLFGTMGPTSDTPDADEVYKHRQGTIGRRGRHDPRRGAAGGDRPRLRHGGVAGTARGARHRELPRGQGHHSRVRDPPGGRAHAGAHERAARRGRRTVRQADRDGRDQPDHGAGRRRGRGRRQRRGQPGGAHRPQEPDRRHADHRRRQGAHGGRRQAQPEPGLRRHPQPAVRGREHPDVLLRRQEGDARAVGRPQGAVVVEVGTLSSRFKARPPAGFFACFVARDRMKRHRSNV
jgi:NAD/NADP transhydrogenase beta subunit